MGYKGTETFHLMVRNIDAQGIVDEWVERNIAADIKIRRAKVKGHVVIETKDVIFSAFIQRTRPNCRVHIQN